MAPPKAHSSHDVESERTTTAAVLARRDWIQNRLKEIALPAAPSPPKRSKKNPTTSFGPHEVPIVVEKTDTHTDFLLKELQWLAADFASERKRHVASSRKLAAAVLQYHKTKAARTEKAIAEARLAQRKRAARIGRHVKNWWTQIEKVITYKQKISLEESRRKEMNQQLVKLVHQTERYAESLRRNPTGNDGLTIEEALASARTTRRSKSAVRNYANFHLAPEDNTLYGASTTEDSGSDGSYDPDDDSDHDSESDDESTLRQAEQEELADRQMQIDAEFVADPEELRQLREESVMDLDALLEKLRQAAGENFMHEEEPKLKRVKFSDVVQTSEVHHDDQHVVEEEGDPGNDADDDADISDVEDFVDQDDDGSYVGEEQIDDETTIAQEEALPRDMSVEDEIELLQSEGDIPIEELRQRYASVFGGPTEPHTNVDSESDNNSVDRVGLAPDAEIASEAIDENLKSESTPSGDGEQSDSQSHKEKSESLLVGAEGSDMDCEVDQDGEGAEHSSSRVSRLLADFGVNDDGENDEYQPDAVEAIDDETTIEAEERLGRDMSPEEEIALLQRESEIPIDQLRAMYEGVERTESDGAQSLSDLLNDPNDDQENDEEFTPVVDEPDDETTIEAEERLGREMSADAEIDLLRKESEIPIEQLRQLYQQMEEDESEELSDVGRKRKRSEMSQPSPETNDDENDEEEVDESDQGQAALSALEASAERAKMTMASRPYLLASWVKMREYQQIGLNWLVSLQSRRLNGILADEMGLGKTLQTIALLAYLAAYKGIWGPHLIIVPTSVIMNWETELKRFGPSLKVLTYYGTAKRRKELRTGWTKTNWYHVVVTSYQLAVQDAFAFKRKKWYYLVLDEAQNIKNFQSQRWQTLIHFNTQRRLLLTGTPLQNNLMELWSLLHFLMPYIFRSRKEFSYWFANPMNSIVEGESQNDDIVRRLHGIIRPFVLRRLKKDVETQMPGKFEHVVKCQLSRRQMFVYEEFMGRSSTRQALKRGGNYMGMMNVLMQLRKVCNHPDLFEPRSVVTPFVLDPIKFEVPALVMAAMEQTSPLMKVSSFLTIPVWCGSCGEPSLTSAIKHDPIESEELFQLKSQIDDNDYMLENADVTKLPPGLKRLVHETMEKTKAFRRDRVAHMNMISDERCQRPAFTFHGELVRAYRTKSHVLDEKVRILETPEALMSAIRSQAQRAQDVENLVKNFVFCVPRASAPRPRIVSASQRCPLVLDSKTEEMLSESLQKCVHPFRKAAARLSSFFPDKKLIQFDSGKLQTLAHLLRELKKGGHRALIFTQMSKMLDTLEAFLNLNGHTYLRLDGSTSVDRRQRLMDRFNNDPKIFCFILSTRSGGMGINLTGADTVIFYDSDWNPAMDAQAQDRAHRIGQTREVHIYRLITEHTIEENILLKAQQKKNLDILVMDKGQFNASQLFGQSSRAVIDADEGTKDVYSKGGLRSILGLATEPATDISDNDEEADQKGKEVGDDQMEKAMASLEDAEDAEALQGALKEAADELREFDESVEYKKDSEDEAEESGQEARALSPMNLDKSVEGTQDDEILEKEFAAWQDKVGVDAAAIEQSLKPTERYGLRFREEIDPFYSIFAVTEYNRRLEAEQNVDDEVDIDEVEREKSEEERLAMEEGDLLATNPEPEDLVRQRQLYQTERARLHASKKRRKLTGDDWERRVDSVSQSWFWYNIDTGEAVWDKPPVLLELEAYKLASEMMWSKLPLQPLKTVMSFLLPHPERFQCAYVCKQWNLGAKDPCFVRHVYPVEMGAYTREDRKIERNHFRTIEDALMTALPGDTIELGDGHYWINVDLAVEKPIRFVGDENNPANVVIEMGGRIRWTARGGWIEGITFRRPKISSTETSARELLLLEGEGKVNIFQSVMDIGDGDCGVLLAAGVKSKGRWDGLTIRGGRIGLSIAEDASCELVNSTISRSTAAGVSCDGSSHLKMTGCRIICTGGVGVALGGTSSMGIEKCHFTNMAKLMTKSETAAVQCAGNTVDPGVDVGRVRGFRVTQAQQL